MTRSPTIIDVARAAGVSQATVSRVLNGGIVAEATSQRVERVIQDIGYRRNTLARGLVTGRTGVVGVLIPDVAGPLYGLMARGIEDALERRGMSFILMTDSRDVRQERASLELLLERQVDALIHVGSQLESSVLQGLLKHGPPAVFVQREILGRDAFATVRLDNHGGVDAAMRHLRSRGHRRIACIAGPRRDGAERLERYRAAMAADGLEPHVVHADGTEEGGFRAGLELAEVSGITAVLCVNDRSALGLYHAARTRGWRIPEDLSVVGFDDLPWCAYLDPPLTTVRQASRDMGRLAAELALRALDHGISAEESVVDASLVPRASVRTIDASEGGE